MASYDRRILLPYLRNLYTLEMMNRFCGSRLSQLQSLESDMEKKLLGEKPPTDERKNQYLQMIRMDGSVSEFFCGCTVDT